MVPASCVKLAMTSAGPPPCECGTTVVDGLDPGLATRSSGNQSKGPFGGQSVDKCSADNRETVVSLQVQYILAKLWRRAGADVCPGPARRPALEASSLRATRT